jgi:penicillin-binding protein 3
MLTMLAACEDDPKPDVAFEAYLEQWESQKFEEMYTQLSTNIKGQMNKEEFVELYSNIYKDIDVSDLKLSFNPPTEEEGEIALKEGTITFTYDLAMKTSAGQIEFSHQATLIQEEIEDEKQWMVEWNPSMIFPEMEAGDLVKLVTLAPNRGEIFDRNGRGLAINGEVFEIGVAPAETEENRDEILSKISESTGMSIESIEAKLTASWVQPHLYVPLTRVPKDEEYIRNLTLAIPEIHVKTVSSRVYPLNEAAAHLIGYVGKITGEDLEELKDKGYGSTDTLGKKGLEMVFEERLRGEAGIRIFVSKDNGDEITLAEKETKHGEEIKLAIDVDAQERIYEQLKDDIGAAAAIHPLTGETLALVSSPSFNPNDFVLGISTEKWQSLSDDPRQPMLNRVGYIYAPGSTFKPITAAIALENNIITPEQTMDITGSTWREDESWGGYQIRRVHDIGRPVNLRDALVYSDNIYFARTALEIGADTFVDDLKNYGFGEALPFEYPFYDSKISNEGLNRDILLADTGYGQGELEMSPLHLALAYTPLLNEGNLLKPKLTLGVGQDITEVWHENVMSPEHAKIILDDLIAVIEDPQGTGKEAKIDGVTLAGKTGTAELKTDLGDSEGKENGLFVAVNTDNPELLIAMLVEDVQGGSGYVVPKVKKVFEEIVK